MSPVLIPTSTTKGRFGAQATWNRLNEATAEWTADTDWDPGVANTSQNIFVDGRLPPTWCADLDSWIVDEGTPDEGTILAVACNRKNARYLSQWGGLYYQIYDADIYFNMEIDESPDWWVGAAIPPQTDRLDFGGILTHEIGHSAGLKHYPDASCVRTSSSWVTMCPFFTNNMDSYWSRSLHADDKESANYAYP